MLSSWKTKRFHNFHQSRKRKRSMLWNRTKVFKRILVALMLKFASLYMYHLVTTDKQSLDLSESSGRAQTCSGHNHFQIPTVVTSSRVRLHSAQAQQLFGTTTKRWTEKLVQFNSICSLVDERRWAVLLAKSGSYFELLSASQEYRSNISSKDRKNVFRPILDNFPYILDSTSKYILQGHRSSLYWFRQPNQLSWRIYNTTDKDCICFQGITFIGRFWCHIPHFMEDLLAMLSVAYQAKIDESQQNLQFRYILPEVSMQSCIMSRNPYFRNILQISKRLLDVWNLSKIQFLFKEDVQNLFLSFPNGSSINTSNKLLCFDQVIYNIRNVPRLGHDVLWVYNLQVISMLRETAYKLIPFLWRIKYSEKFAVTLLQRKHTRRIINIESLATAIRDFFGVNTRIVYFEETSLWYQIMVMKTTRVFVAAHGAGLTNVIYMRQGSAVIEVSNFGCYGEPYFGSLAELSGLSYWNWKPLVPSKIIKKLDRKYVLGSYVSAGNCTRWRRNADTIVAEHDILEFVRKALLKTEHLD